MMVKPPKEIIEFMRKCQDWRIWDPKSEKLILKDGAPEDVKEAYKKVKEFKMEVFKSN